MDDPLIWQLLLQVVLIAINALFAMTEIAVISLNESKVERLAEEGDKGAKKLLYLTRDSSRFLSTIQVVITLAGFLGSAFAADNFADRFVSLLQGWGVTMNPETLNSIAVVVTTLILSYFTLIFGELVPKRVAQKNPERVARRVAGFIRACSIVFKPIVWFLTKSVNAVLRLLRIDPNDTEEDVSEDDIRLMVDIGKEKGTIGAEEREMIDNIFEFNDSTAEDLMIHRTDAVVLWVDEEPSLLETQITESGHSRFPVYDEDMDDIVGVLYLRDYFTNLRQKEPKPLREILRAPYFVPESVKADALFRDMQKRHTHMAIVVDEYGGFYGILTLEDLLEEIVGNIYDEYDPVERDVENLGDGVWRMRGSLDLETVGKTLGVEDLPEEEFDTLGGMIFGALGVVPDDCSHPEVDAYGLHIRVDEIEDRRIEWAVVSKLETPEVKNEKDAKHQEGPAPRREGGEQKEQEKGE